METEIKPADVLASLDELVARLLEENHSLEERVSASRIQLQAAVDARDVLKGAVASASPTPPKSPAPRPKPPSSNKPAPKPSKKKPPAGKKQDWGPWAANFYQSSKLDPRTTKDEKLAAFARKAWEEGVKPGSAVKTWKKTAEMAGLKQPEPPAEGGPVVYGDGRGLELAALLKLGKAVDRLPTGLVPDFVTLDDAKYAVVGQGDDAQAGAVRFYLQEVTAAPANEPEEKSTSWTQRVAMTEKGQPIELAGVTILHRPSMDPYVFTARRITLVMARKGGKVGG